MEFVEIELSNTKQEKKSAPNIEEKARQRRGSDEVQFKKLLLQTQTWTAYGKHLHCSIDQVNERHLRVQRCMHPSRC